MHLLYVHVSILVCALEKIKTGNRYSAGYKVAERKDKKPLVSGKRNTQISQNNFVDSIFVRWLLFHKITPISMVRAWHFVSCAYVILTCTAIGQLQQNLLETALYLRIWPNLISNFEMQVALQWYSVCNKCVFFAVCPFVLCNECGIIVGNVFCTDGYNDLL